MPATKKAPSSTKYANAKQHRIFLTAKGRPFTRSTAGKVSYGAKAKFVTNTSGNLRKVTPGNMKNIPNAMRPSNRTGDSKPSTVSKATVKRVRLVKPKSYANITRGPKARAVRKNKGVSRKTESAKAATKAASKMMTAAKRAARKPTVSNARKVQSAASKVATAAKRVRKSNSAKATNMFAKVLNRTRKAPRAKASARPRRARAVRKNKGVSRKTESAKGATRAASKMMTAAKRAAARGPDRRRKTNSAKARTSAAAKARRTVARPRAIQSNSLRATNIFRKILNKRGAPRKARSNKGATRTLIASPGGSIYKGMGALTRALGRK
jgi:hypothetical protein